VVGPFFMATLLAARGDRERAMASYERSIQLNPNNATGASALERLRAQQRAGETPSLPGAGCDLGARTRY
jgi:hypothetical protein